MAWSRNEDKSIAVSRAEDLFNDIEKRYASGESYFRADTGVYNALIKCEILFCSFVHHMSILYR